MIISGDTITPTNSTNIIVPNGTGISVGNKEVLEFNSSGILNQAPGSIIESLWSTCDGSTHILNSGSYTVQNVSAVQVLSNTYADITGSSITYQPPFGATKVIYRFIFSVYWVTGGTHPITHYKFFIGSDEVIFARNNRNGAYENLKFPFEWVIKITGATDTNNGTLASWNVPITLKMQARNYATGSNDGNLHGTNYWDGAGANQFNMPIINIIAIR